MELTHRLAIAGSPVARWRTWVAMLAVVASVFFIPLQAQAASKAWLSPCYFLGNNLISGGLKGNTWEHPDDPCSWVDVYSMRYLNYSYVYVTSIDSGTDPISDNITRSGVSIDWTKHRANDGTTSPLYILYN